MSGTETHAPPSNGSASSAASSVPEAVQRALDKAKGQQQWLLVVYEDQSHWTAPLTLGDVARYEEAHGEVGELMTATLIARFAWSKVAPAEDFDEWSSRVVHAELVTVDAPPPIAEP